MLETSRFTSYSACGIPFVVGGVVAGGVDALVARSPEEHRRRGIDVRTNHEATAIDLDAGEVEFLDQHAGTRRPHRLRPVDARHRRRSRCAPTCRASTCRSSTACSRSTTPRRCWRWRRRRAGASSSSAAATSAWRWPRRTSSAGCTATVVERGPQPLGVVDVDFGARVAEAMRVARHRRPLRRRRRGVRAGGRASRRTGRSRPTSSSSASACRPRSRARRRRPASSSAAGGAVLVDDRQATSAPPACGRPATAPRPPTSSPASRCTSPSARTPTSTAGSPASTWPAATPARRGCSARRSPSCARWRSP